MNQKIKTNHLLILFFLVLRTTYGQVNMHYEISFKSPDEHYVEIQLICEGLEEGTTTFELPVWSPGYYKILDFPKNIVDFEVKTMDGTSLGWNKTAKNLWQVENEKNKEIFVTYRVYANKKSVAESNVSVDRAFIMPTTMFMHVENGIDNPVTLHIKPYSSWNTISTGLQKREDNFYYAENFDILYDSPIYIGNQETFNFNFNGKSYHLGISNPKGLDETEFIEDLKKIISATTDLMQHVPYENYAFIMMEQGGGGLEHWNSQAVFTSGSFEFKSEEDYTDFLNFITHEYFHLYNVKAIRPFELGPFDYGKENYTDMLWVSEGVTVYYEYILMMRAGLLEPQKALDYLSRSIMRYENLEGNKHMSLSRSSFDIWLNFLSREENTNETTISYYNKGPIIGLLLDLAIRQGSSNKKSLDDVMRFLYTEYYLNQGRGFKKQQFWDVCENMAGVSLDELRRYVEKVSEIDYQKYLDYAGLKIDLSVIEEKDDEPVKRSFQLSEVKNPTKVQASIRAGIFSTNK